MGPRISSNLLNSTYTYAVYFSFTFGRCSGYVIQSCCAWPVVDGNAETEAAKGMDVVDGGGRW